MTQTDFGTGKSLVVLAIVLGCFTVLWPKIFYPMMQTAFAMTSPKSESDSFKEPDKPPHLHPGSINPRLMPEDVQDKFNMRDGRPFPHPQARQPMKSQPKSGGAMSIIMPIYTVGIIIFFLYTVLKLVFKKPSDADKKPLIKDFHMDPEYRKFICQQTKNSTKVIKEEKKYSKKHGKYFNTHSSENSAQEFDEKDYEIFKLKKKLEETEQAMERIMKHMGAMSACLSENLPMENNGNPQDNDMNKLIDNTSDLKNCLKNAKGSFKSQQQNEKNSLKHDSCKKLQQDLAKLINLANAPNEQYNEIYNKSHANGQVFEEIKNQSEEETENFETDSGSSSDEKEINQESEFGKNIIYNEKNCNEESCMSINRRRVLH